MSNSIADANLAQPFDSVNSPINSQLLLSPVSVIHHKVLGYPRKRIILRSTGSRDKPYGVSREYRILSPQLFLKKFDYIRDCLRSRLGLTIAQREATLRLLRLWSYYGYVCPCADHVVGTPDVSPEMVRWRAEQGLGKAPSSSGVSKATYWRTIRILESLGLIEVINRYVLRPHAQISNLYILTQLCKVIARYLAEHGYWVWGKWLEPMLAIPDLVFWAFLHPARESRASPG